MNGTDDRDERIRKLFSRLPREKAPEDFEQRVASAVAGRRTDSSEVGSRIRAFAVPGLAVLLVGVLSILIYRNQSGPDAETGLPAADSAAIQAAPPDASGRPGGKRESPGGESSMPEEAADGGTEPKRNIPAPGPTPADFAKRAKTAPIRPMMEAPAIEGGAPTDSLAEEHLRARRDSIVRLDSVARPDSLVRRDSLGLDSPEETPDSLRESGSPPKRE